MDESCGSTPASPDCAQPLSAAAQWAQVATTQSTLGGLLAALDDGLPVPAEVIGEVERLMASPLPGASSLPEILESLLAEADDPELLIARECVREQPTLRSLGCERGVTHQAVRKKVAQDGKVVRERLDDAEYRPIRWAIDRFQAEIGPMRNAGSEVIRTWQERLGEPSFEMLRWLAGYSYRDDWLQRGRNALNELKALVNDAIGDEWLVPVDQVVREVPAFGDTAAANAFLVKTGKWRDIGDGWLIRWEGPIQAKAERVLRLTCRPMTPAELVDAIGGGSEGGIKNQRGDRLIRVDKHFRLALPEWGLEEYEGIVTEIRQRIQRGGGVASKAAIIAEFTREFDVAGSSIESYLSTPIFDVSGDAVRLGDDTEFSPKAPTTVPGTVQTETGWGERHRVTEGTFDGYSFAVNPHVCFANGLRPGANLVVPLNSSQSHQASVIWRTTNTLRTVDVGRTRPWLKENGVGIGTEVLVCPTPERVTLFVGTDAIEAARAAFDATAPPIAPDIAALMEGL